MGPPVIVSDYNTTKQPGTGRNWSHVSHKLTATSIRAPAHRRRLCKKPSSATPTRIGKDQIQF